MVVERDVPVKASRCAFAGDPVDQALGAEPLEVAVHRGQTERGELAPDKDMKFLGSGVGGQAAECFQDHHPLTGQPRLGRQGLGRFVSHNANDYH